MSSSAAAVLTCLQEGSAPLWPFTYVSGRDPQVSDPDVMGGQASSEELACSDSAVVSMVSGNV